MNCKFWYFFLLIASCFFVKCVPNKNVSNELTLFVAASLTDVITELAHEYSVQTNVEVKLNTASSGILARQIEKGADFDYYISASKDWMDYLDSLHLISSKSKRSIAGNRMVAIVPKDSEIGRLDTLTINYLPELFKGRLSIGEPSHVPAGKYASQIIKKYSWQQQFENRLQPAKNVRDALFMVELGELEMGMVYLSDAQKSTKVKVIFEFKEEDSDPIEYYAATKIKKDKKTDDFIRFLNSKKSKSVWKKKGFNVN